MRVLLSIVLSLSLLSGCAGSKPLPDLPQIPCPIPGEVTLAACEVKACAPAGTPDELAGLPLERQLEHATICHELDLKAWEGCAVRQQKAAEALRDVAAKCVIRARSPD